MAFKLPKFAFGSKLDAILTLISEIESVTADIDDIVTGVDDGIGQEDVTAILILANKLNNMATTFRLFIK